MLPDRVSNPGPLTYESGVLPIALRGPAFRIVGPTSRSQLLFLVKVCQRSSAFIYILI